MFIAGLSRRTLVAASGAALLSSPARGAQTGRRIATPAQDEGPFYPTAYPSSTDNDLVRLTGSDVPALGTVAHLHGAVTTLDGAPVAGAGSRSGSPTRPANTTIRPRSSSATGTCGSKVSASPRPTRAGATPSAPFVP